MPEKKTAKKPAPKAKTAPKAKPKTATKAKPKATPKPKPKTAPAAKAKAATKKEAPKEQKFYPHRRKMPPIRLIHALLRGQRRRKKHNTTIKDRDVPTLQRLRLSQVDTGNGSLTSTAHFLESP